MCCVGQVEICVLCKAISVCCAGQVEICVV